ncbi:MAG TPA: Hsp20/alpha crystallin family protein [Fimbriimonas sp.]
MQRSTPEPGKRLLDVLEQAIQPHENALHGRKRIYQPPVDVKETHREVVVFADIPGMDEDDIDIAVEGEALIITGCREFDLDSEDPEEFLRIERPYGGFRCMVPLPCAIDFDLATARYKRGVLKVRLPKPVVCVKKPTASDED